MLVVGACHVAVYKDICVALAFFGDFLLKLGNVVD